MSDVPLPAGWRWVPIGSVCKVIPGFAFKSKDWTTDGIPVIKIKNIRPDGSINTNELDHVPAEVCTPKLNKFVLHDQDLLIAMTGATAGKVGRLRTDRTMMLNQRVAKFQPFDVDRKFIWAVVSSEEYQRRFFHLADGAAQPNMSGSQIEGLRIPLPPPATQRRIGEILGAYDDLIENNTRRIAILGEMARRLYEEWFVRFRFPGHEQIRLLDSAFGPIPEGWEVAALGELAAFRPGNGKITKKLFAEEGFTAYSASGPDGLLPGYEVEGRGIVISSVGAYAGRTWLARGRWSCIANTIRFVPIDPEVSSEFLYLATKGVRFWPRRGSAQPFISINDARNCRIVRPVYQVLKQASEPLRVFLDQAEVLNCINANLHAQRDFLLPKLISGEIDMSEAPSAEEVAAA